MTNRSFQRLSKGLASEFLIDGSDEEEEEEEGIELSDEDEESDFRQTTGATETSSGCVRGRCLPPFRLAKKQQQCDRKRRCSCAKAGSSH